MNRSTLSALVVALMLGSGIAGYLIGKPADTVDRPRRPRAPRTATPPPGDCRPPTPAAPRAHAGRPTGGPGEAFAYRRISIDSAAAEAEACLFFNKPLASADTVKYADYLRLSPEAKSAVRAVDDKLCIAGLAYGQDYAVTLLPGLPGADGSQARRGAQGRRGARRRVRPRSPCRARASSCRAAPLPACRSAPSTSASSASRSIA